MFVKIKLPFETTSKELENHFKNEVSKYLSNSPLPNNMLKLESYIHENYSMSMPLRNILTNIVNSIKITEGSEDYNVIIGENKLDEIARLITFGNINIKGNPILLKAFLYAKTQL